MEVFILKTHSDEPFTFLTLGDPHFKVNNVVQSKEMTTAFIKLAKKLKPDFIINMGDTLHNHEKINVTILCNANDFLRELSKIAPLFVLIGNHDRSNNTVFMNDVHPFNGLKGQDNITIVDKTNIWIYKGLTLGFIPYVSPGRFKEAVGDIRYDIIFAHQEFKGSMLNTKIKSKNGDIFNDSIVISGHIHGRHRLKNIYYVGSPMQQSFGEMGEKTVSLFSVYGNKLTEKRYDLGLTRRFNVTMDVKEAETYERLNDGVYKIIIKDTKSRLDTFKYHPNRAILTKGGLVLYMIVREKIEVKIIHGSFTDNLREKADKDERELLEEILNS
uniref:DNA repair exonuclease n=1 Tax=Pithovirus LCPAC406 TaxID=2506599 RepID=A0A481ZG93_9VIRU|nr:MAG: DNA repair exonuclease [Pithovirus LCPAC406]